MLRAGCGRGLGVSGPVFASDATVNVPLDFDSTLVRRGVRATTIADMRGFVAGLMDRPLDKLLCDLPGLALLSETKFMLAQQVLRRRLHDLPEVEREQLRILARTVATEASAWAGDRILRLFERE